MTIDTIIPILTLFFLFFSIITTGSIAGLYSEKAGIVNIAINGIMIIGATTYGLFSILIGIPNMAMQLLLIPLAALFSGLFALLHGFITIKLKGNHIISGVALNILAPAVSFVLLKIYGKSNRFESVVNELAFGQNKEFLNIFSLKLFILIGIIVITWFIFSKTKLGLRISAVGENPHAAAAAGINVDKLKWLGVFLSGIIGGIAGAFYFQYAGSTFRGNVQGLGFLSLTILIMGRWKIIFIVISGLIFPFLYTLSINLAGNFGNFLPIVEAAPYLFTIILLALSSKKDLAPKALGIPYDKSLK
ncbi:ABC transporter permease [Mesomycoplasma hyopneumoniae]|uniref:ABC transporter permease n=2 Tax=Mesomycoplasma hyopneumoniae TaxID=2099 RepID=A0ABD4SXR4_MESHO|nr:ABC transporter permease [Mesomycoplasma hyopneumoniae]AAZ44693.2 putative sugar ABC transporter permease protein [Mesomycoplasma hyopneumoniae J]MCI8283634.1 ABC transporter permease [Mesomycoplasma hyopneumoniae]MCI8298555.1 ABC transporter permease [Mesomycoplasma hyopneumoniae]MCI8298723.1 ABC transporter permease [Mesomycoplasma hyopneumoniae]MXR10937.1 ABC transporter permease [Mesomycoplasma hyopneumoniae]